MPVFGSAHWPYIIILLVIVLIIWGPGKLPDVGAGLGRAIREFRKASTEVRDQGRQCHIGPTGTTASGGRKLGAGSQAGGFRGAAQERLIGPSPGNGRRHPWPPRAISAGRH